MWNLASAGLTVLFDVREVAAEQGRDFRFGVSLSDHQPTFRITGLRERFVFVDKVPGSLIHCP